MSVLITNSMIVSDPMNGRILSTVGARQFVGERCIESVQVRTNRSELRVFNPTNALILLIKLDMQLATTRRDQHRSGEDSNLLEGLRNQHWPIS